VISCLDVKDDYFVSCRSLKMENVSLSFAHILQADVLDRFRDNVMVYCKEADKFLLWYFMNVHAFFVRKS
jgi:hypothetical protein